MKVLRCSIYESPTAPPLTIVTRACDLHEPVEVAARDLETMHPGTFIVVDIFDVEPAVYDSELASVHAGMQRLKDSVRALDERNMAVSYYWNAMHLKITSREGALANPNRAPLSKAQLEVVMRQLVRHPNYQAQHIFMISKDGDVVTA